MKSALLCAWLAGSVALQSSAPPEAPQTPASPALPGAAPVTDEPAAQPAPSPWELPGEQPKKKKRKKKRRRSDEPAQASPQPETPRRKAKRTVVARPSLARLAPWEFVTPLQPLTLGERGMLLAAQAGCAAIGTAGTLAALAGAGLAARTLDRPSGWLTHPPLPVGGVVPLAVGAAGTGVVTSLCVVGLGALAERRWAGVAAALVPWAGLAPVAASVVLTVIAWPVMATTRNRVLKENAVAGALVALAVGVPLLSLLAYHGGALLQERQQDRALQDERAAAIDAVHEDAAKAAAPAPAVEVAPPEPPAPAAEPEPTTTQPAPLPAEPGPQP